MSRKHVSGSAIIVCSLLLSVLLTPIHTYAGQVDCSLTYSQPTLDQSAGFDRVIIPESFIVGEPGSPALPVAGVWLLLPPGEMAVSVELRDQEWRTIPGTYNIEPIQAPRRLSDSSPIEFTSPDPAIYNADRLYPAQAVGNLQTHLKRGFALATVAVTPVRWNPVVGSLEYLSQAELFVSTEPGELQQIGFDDLYRGDQATMDWVRDQVRNEQALGFYPRRDIDSGEAMLIITHEDLFDVAAEYAKWRSELGIATRVALVEDLLEEFQGDSDPEKIRTAIYDAYSEDEVDYILLLGDDEQIPHRGCYGVVGQTVDNDIPTDMYFSNLDGNWNSDGDGRFGEQNEADLLSEVALGRIPADDIDEALRMLDKVMLYVEEPVVEDVLNVLMVGENLDWNVMGGEYMDEVYAETNRWGYNTSGFPERYDEHRTNLYDLDRVWSANNDLAPLISDGAHFVHHLGHANVSYVMKFQRRNISNDLISNDGIEKGLSIGYSQGCYCGAFDNRNDGGNYGADCIIEKFTVGLDGGFVAYIANTRFGWGSGNNTNGASQRYEREFVDAVYGSDITIIGKANNDSKEDVIPVMDAGVMRWCLYETTLYGDPAMDMWTDTPLILDVDYPAVLVLGDDDMELTVDGVEGATVCLSRDGEILAVTQTDANGNALLEMDSPLHDTEPLRLSVVAHDYLVFSESLNVIAPDVGYPWLSTLEIIESDGNGDGLLDYAETADIYPIIRNLGRESLTGLTLTAVCEDEYITLSESMIEYEEIPVEADARAEACLQVIVSASVPDLHEVTICLTMQDESEEIWTQNVPIILHAPILSEYAFVINDVEENNNGRFDPGEEAEVQLLLSNLGSGPVYDINAELICENEYVEIVGGEIRLDSLMSDWREPFNQSFSVRISEDAPNPYRAVFYIRLSASRELTRSHLIDQGIGGFLYNFEDDEVLAHDAIDDFTDEWHLSFEDNFTPSGSGCLKVGSDQPDEDYGSLVNCVAYLPEFEVNGPLELAFRHRIDAETRDDSDSCFDGGFVEISVEGEEWATIEPELSNGRGYPYEIYQGQSRNPLADGQSCYSGEHDWEPALFDLSDYERLSIQVRFHFGSDSTVHRGGWWIDDIEYRLPVEIEPPYELAGEMLDTGADLTWISPDVMRDEGLEPNILIGYRLYRNGDLLDTLIRDTRYFDYLVGNPRGSYEYMITAEYNTGESPPGYPMVRLYWTAAAPNENQPIPEKWSLSAIWPNPFNQTTRLSYTVPALGDVQLSVFDLSGRLVTQLVDGYHDPGNYQAVFRADGLSSGLYIVKMSTPKGAITGKLVLIR